MRKGREREESELVAKHDVVCGLSMSANERPNGEEESEESIGGEESDEDDVILRGEGGLLHRHSFSISSSPSFFPASSHYQNSPDLASDVFI